MTKRIKSMLELFAVVLVSCCLFTSLSFGQALPKPGEVIDKSNYKTYAHLFLPDFLPAFEDGFGGLMEPVRFPVVESKPLKMLSGMVALSEKNRGKFGVDQNGLITGGYTNEGLPFPDLKKDDKDFALKLMWNYKMRYLYDDHLGYGNTWMQRKGEPARNYAATNPILNCYSRLFQDPKPTYKNPLEVKTGMLWHYTKPDSVKNTMTLQYQFMDLARADEIYLYLPAFRRVIRGEGGQRSAPMTGAILSLDEALGGFNGTINEFTYKVLGEQKTLPGFRTFDPSIEFTRKDVNGFSNLSPYQVRDVYRVEITPKNPKYPCSKKIITIDKETLHPYQTVMWDRAGKLWKVFHCNYTEFPTPDNKELFDVCNYVFGIDNQFGMTMHMNWHVKVNSGMKFEDFTQSALIKRGM